MSERGNMDVAAQRGTYTDFTKLVKWTCISVALVLIILAITIA